MIETSNGARTEARILPPNEAANLRAAALQTRDRAETEARIKVEQKLLLALPFDSPEAETHRQRLKRLAARWRDDQWGATARERFEMMNAPAAAKLLQLSQEGLTALIEWGLLTPCYLPMRTNPQVDALLLRRAEVNALLKAETWWRGLAALTR
jgi:hypothetical protein